MKETVKFPIIFKKEVRGPKIRRLCALFLLVFGISGAQPIMPPGDLPAGNQPVSAPGTVPLLVKKVNDFEINGSGTDPAWEVTGWNRLTKLDKSGPDYPSRYKILYSQKGIYLLFQGLDHKITTSDYEDMDHIWNGDVFELFFHPDPAKSVYFEYEVNPFGKQLLLTISDSGNGMGWIPFNEDGGNNYGTYAKTKVSGGQLKRGGRIASWTAEVFLSYKSLGLLPRVPPQSGTVWNANFCRLDYDTGQMIKWSWTAKIKNSFHELDKFRTVVFE